MLTALLCRLVILLFGTLYPAFASYKAIRCKDIKGYVKWTMYWVVFALFISVETFTDLLLSWLPFYYELKIVLVVWLMSPATHGSSLLYKQLVHPWLRRNETEIERCIEQARQHGYAAVVTLGTRGVSYATQMLLQTAMAGGSGLVTQLRRSYSVNDVSDLSPTKHGGQQCRPLAVIRDEVTGDEEDETDAQMTRSFDDSNTSFHSKTTRRRQQASDSASVPSGRRRSHSLVGDEEDHSMVWSDSGGRESGADADGASVSSYCTLRRSTRRAAAGGSRKRRQQTATNSRHAN